MFRVKQKSIQFPKHGKSILWEKYRKTQTSESYGLLSNFAYSRNPYNSQDMRKVNSQCKRKNIGKHKHSKVKGFLHILCETEIHAILKPWDE